MKLLVFKKAEACLQRFLLSVVLAAALAGCGTAPTAGPRDDPCTYPGSSVQCRGLNPG